MRRLLITGFDPFGGGSRNPSWEAVQALPETLGDFRVYRQLLPTVYGKAAAMVLAAAEEIKPHVIISLGLAGGCGAVTPERIAVNIRDARIADNEGNRFSGERIDPQGPAACFSTLPVEIMAQAIRDAGVPGAVSNTAGTFVCNDVMYTLLCRYAGTEVKTGFVHLPNLPDMGDPSLSMEEILKALTAAISCL